MSLHQPQEACRFQPIWQQSTAIIHCSNFAPSCTSVLPDISSFLPADLVPLNPSPKFCLSSALLLQFSGSIEPTFFTSFGVDARADPLEQWFLQVFVAYPPWEGFLANSLHRIPQRPHASRLRPPSHRLLSRAACLLAMPYCVPAVAFLTFPPSLCRCPKLLSCLLLASVRLLRHRNRCSLFRSGFIRHPSPPLVSPPSL